MVVGYVVVAASAVTALGSALRTNDDAVMFASVSGFNGGQPQPELILSHVGVGLALRGLYAAAEIIPWYGLYLHIGLALGMIAVTGAALVLTERRRTAALAAVGTVAVATVVAETTSLQFTVVAILLSGGGVLLHAALRQRDWSPWRAALLGGAIALLGLTVRLQGFVLSVTLVGMAVGLRGLARRSVGAGPQPSS